ncbi:MAG: helix-turn-helix domain-containing protein [Acidobacteriota bacterium]
MKTILGSRLRRAREELGLSQADLARKIKISNEHIWHLEHGKRSPSLDVLTRLAEFFKKDIGYFIKEKEASFQLLFQEKTLDKKTKSYLRKFKKHCQDYLLLEKLTGNRLPNAPLYHTPDPEKMAIEERQRLGLGNHPLRNVFFLLEQQNFHLIRQCLGTESQITGIFIYLNDEDEAFALINASLSEEKQTLAAVHLYGHFLKDRLGGPIIDNPDVFIDEYLELYHPREKFSQIFTSRFLLPRTFLKDLISSFSKKSFLDLEVILYLKRITGVEQQVLLSALQEMEVLTSTHGKDLNKLDLNKEAEKFFSIPERTGHPKLRKGQIIISDRFYFLACGAFRKKKITLEETAQLTGVEKNKISSFFRKK